MLDFMRKAAKTVFIKAFLIILIISFAAWGIGDVFNNRGADVGVASVGETDIPVQEFRSAFAREVQRVQQFLGPQVTREQAVAMGVGDLVLQRMVSSAVLNAGANDMGLLVSTSAILADISTNPEFFNDAKVFDRRVFVELLSRNGLSEDEYVARVRTNMGRSQYLSPITSGPQMPASLTQALYALAAEKRVLEVLRINHAQIKNVPTPTAADLAAYHQANQQLFMFPEYRGLSTLVLDAASIAKTVAVSQDDLQTAYDERADEFSTPPSRVLKQVLVTNEADATRAAQLLDSGKSIDDVTQEVGGNPAMSTIGSMTSAQAAALSPEIANAAFTAPIGGHTAPVQSPLGWHVILVISEKPGTVQTLADVKDMLTQQVKMERAVNDLFSMSNKLEDLLGGGMTLNEAAAELGADVVSVAAVDANGLDRDNAQATLPYSAEVIAEAVKLQPGGESQLVETGDGNAFFIVHVNDVYPPALRPLDSVLKNVTTAWDANTRAELAAAAAKTATIRLEGGETLQAVAKDMGFDGFITDPFTRDGQGLKLGALPASAITQAFALTKGGVAQAPGTGAHTVARVLDIQAATGGVDDPLYVSVSDKTSSSLQGDLAAQLSAALQARHPVVLNQSVLDEVY